MKKILLAMGLLLFTVQAPAKKSIKQDFKDVGHAIKKGAKDTGHAAKKVPRKIGHGFKKAGRDLKKDVTGN